MSSVDLATAFVRLWDEHHHLWNLTDAEDILTRLAEFAIDDLLVVDELEEADVGAFIGEPRLALHLALRIDMTLGRLHPARSAGAGVALEDDRLILERYWTTGNLVEPPVSGGLLFRWSSPACCDTVFDLFMHVVRVPHDEWCGMAVVMPEPWDDPQQVALRGQRDLVVGCVPVLEAPESLVASVVDGRFYVFEPDTASVKPLLPLVLANLDASGCVLGLLPEVSLNDELLAEWEAVLSANPPSPGSRLTWLLVGTGPVGAAGGRLPPNEAVLLARDGRRIAQQQKRFRYLIEGSTFESWGLAGAIGASDLDEGISTGNTLTLIESLWGRIVILICEDLARPIQGGSTVRYASPSLVLTPVLDSPLSAQRWERHAGSNWLRGIGAQVVVSNSRVIGALQGVHGGTSLGLHRDGAVEVGHSGGAVEVAVMELT